MIKCRIRPNIFIKKGNWKQLLIYSGISGIAHWLQVCLDVKSLKNTGHLRLRKLSSASYDGLKKSTVWKAMASFLKLVNSAGLQAYFQLPQLSTNT